MESDRYLGMFLCSWLGNQQDTILLIMKELWEIDKAEASDSEPVGEAVIEAVHGAMDETVN